VGHEPVAAADTLALAFFLLGTAAPATAAAGTAAYRRRRDDRHPVALDRVTEYPAHLRGVGRAPEDLG
jgi:hypothetical protein